MSTAQSTAQEEAGATASSASLVIDHCSHIDIGKIDFTTLVNMDSEQYQDAMQNALQELSASDSMEQSAESISQNLQLNLNAQSMSMLTKMLTQLCQAVAQSVQQANNASIAVQNAILMKNCSDIKVGILDMRESLKVTKKMIQRSNQVSNMTQTVVNFVKQHGSNKMEDALSKVMWAMAVMAIAAVMLKMGGVGGFGRGGGSMMMMPTAQGGFGASAAPGFLSRGGGFGGGMGGSMTKKMMGVSAAGVAGLAIWYLGKKDCSDWNVICDNPFSTTKSAMNGLAGLVFLGGSALSMMKL